MSRRNPRELGPMLDPVLRNGVIHLDERERARILRALRGDYDDTHWCEDCAPEDLSTMLAPDARVPSAELGALASVSYIARKKGELVEWVHRFRARARPVLAYNPTGLIVLGGDYTVTTDGIEG